MENGPVQKWGFEVKQELDTEPATTIRDSLSSIIENINKKDPRPIIPLGYGDPAAFPCFRTAIEAEDAIVDAVRSAKYNCYSFVAGVLPTKR